MIPNVATGTVACASLREYQATLSRSLFPSRLTATEQSDPFHAVAEVRRFGALSIVKAHANSSVRVRRDSCGREVRDDFVLHLQLTGSATYSHVKGYLECAPECLLLARTGSLLAAEQHGPADAIVIRMPSEFVRGYIKDADDLCWTTAGARQGSADILRNFILSVWSWCDDLQVNDHRFLPVSLVHLLQCAFHSDAGRSGRAGHEPVFDRLRREISMRLDGGSLAVDDVARAVGVSRSKLYGVTSLAGTTVERLIFDMRLERVAVALADENAQSRSITELALDAGFRDLSHFFRRFKQKFRQSPSEYRALGAGRHASVG